MSKYTSFTNRDRFIELGLVISALRKMSGMSQEQLAEKANVSRSHISAIEAPNIVRPFSLEILFNIADALEVAPSKLIGTSMLPDDALDDENKTVRKSDNDVLCNDIAARIKQLRLNAGYSLKELSKKLECSVAHVHQVEAGVRKVSVSELVKIAEIFNVSLDYLIVGRNSSISDKLDELLASLSPEQRDSIYTALNSINDALSE